MKKYNKDSKPSTKMNHPPEDCEKYNCEIRVVAGNWKKPEKIEWDEENHPESMCEEFGCKAISIWVDPS